MISFGIKEIQCGKIEIKSLINYVGMTGFEPATPSSRTKYPAGAGLHPENQGKQK